MIKICGIICAKTKEQFIKTYEANRDRGDYSFGGCFAVGLGYDIVKRKDFNPEDLSDDAKFYLGHSRAPTCNHTEEFDPDNSHPFESESWVVGHNGIIKNYEKLKAEGIKCVDVDSSLLPHMLDTYPLDSALKKLDGIFGLWAYHKNSQTVYVARCASTLYYNEEENIISSAKIENSILLDEGIVYEWHPEESLKEISTFEYDSPYLIF